jgi:type I restriction enzyme R subunit
MNAHASRSADKPRSQIDRQLLVCGWAVQLSGEICLAAVSSIAVGKFRNTSGPEDCAATVDRLTFAYAKQRKPQLGMA